MPMSFVKKTLCRSFCVGILFLLPSLLSAQTTPAATDPGPRPTGNQVKNHSGVKFSNTVVDSAQPTDGTNAGAGNVLASTLVGTGSSQVNFGAFWGQALTVFGTSATVNGATGTILGLG